MRTFTWAFLTHAALLCTSFSSLGYSQAFFACEDTNYESNTQPNILRSQYHLLQTFGDASFRTSNFFEQDYNGSVAWMESRFFFPRLSEIIDSPVPLPDPYITGILKGLKDIDWEDRWDYGIGVEWRPLKKVNPSESALPKWTWQLRLYAVYFQTSYLKISRGGRSSSDSRIGIEFYRECNLYNSTRTVWAELWADGSWRETNFTVNEFRSITFAFVPKLGVKLLPSKALSIMPYLTGEVVITGRSEFWQNRALIGVGVRMMPFRQRRDGTRVFLKGLRIYAEVVRVVAYFKDQALPNIPEYDFRIGVNFTLNRW